MYYLEVQYCYSCYLATRQVPGKVALSSRFRRFKITYLFAFLSSLDGLTFAEGQLAMRFELSRFAEGNF